MQSYLHALSLMGKYTKQIYLYILFFLALCLVLLYRLDYTALESYDEAWYASITRNLVNSKNPFELKFNDQVFLDHPPAGFVAFAVPTFLFGSSEFSARFTSAVLASATVLLTFAIGSQIHSKKVGLAAAVMLLSSLWFILRARSGNLDIPVLFWTTLTYFFLIKSTTPTYLYAAAVAFGVAVLTKTFVAFGMTPVVMYYLYSNRKHFDMRTVMKSCLLFFSIVGFWYGYQLSEHSKSFIDKTISVGLRQENNEISFETIITKSSLYLQSGLGKWFKVFLLSIPIGIVSFVCKKNLRKEHLLLSLYLAGLLLPFVISSQSEVWHFIPSYTPIVLLTSYHLFSGISLLPKRFHFTQVALLIFLVLLAGYQFKQIYNLTYFSEPEYSTEKDVSLHVQEYETVYSFVTFYPALVYYSNTHVVPLRTDPHATKTLIGVLESQDEDVAAVIDTAMYEELLSKEIDFHTTYNNQSFFVITPPQN